MARADHRAAPEFILGESSPGRFVYGNLGTRVFEQLGINPDNPLRRAS